MDISTISPREADRRFRAGEAVLVDIREPNERARESISGSISAPLSNFDAHSLAGKRTVIFHCQSGKRTADNAAKLGQCGAADVCLLEGGLAGWKAAGYPTRLDRTKPIEMQRQVQIGAGTLVLFGVVLSALVSPWFAVLAGFVGAGLVFAGVSGWCGMARLLELMPWNRMAA